jgi:hypothetical protein
VGQDDGERAVQGALTFGSLKSELSNRGDRGFELRQLRVAAFFELAATAVGVERFDLALDRGDFALDIERLDPSLGRGDLAVEM